MTRKTLHPCRVGVWGLIQGFSSNSTRCALINLQLHCIPTPPLALPSLPLPYDLIISNHLSSASMKPKPRRHRPCHRHPDQPHSSLCASCLRERLSLLNPSPAGISGGPTASSSSTSTAPFPELRRSRTFSENRRGSFGPTCESGRRSCEVRPRSTLEDLFTVTEEEVRHGDCYSAARHELESKNLGFLGDTSPVPEVIEEEDEEEKSDCEIRVSADLISPNINVNAGAIDRIFQEEEFEDSRPMKEFIDLELRSDIKPSRRDFKEIAGSFWVAASVFSKKLQKWKRNQKNGRRLDDDCDRGGGLGEMRLEMLRGKRLRDTQSEVGECGFGRRSCDSDPRVSIDLGRASIDGGGYSGDHVIGRRIHDPHPRRSLDLARASIDCGSVFVDDERQGSVDAPRASWDGCVNGRTIPVRATPMVSVIENAMATVYGFDPHTLVFERLNAVNKDPKSFSGIKQLDPLPLPVRKMGFDRSNSKRNGQLINDKDGKNPQGEIEILHNTKLIITEKELMGSKTRFSKDDSSDSGTVGTTSKDTATSSASSSSCSRNEIPDSRKWGKLSNIRALFTRQKHRKSSEKEKLDPPRKIEGNGDTEEANSDRKWKLVRSSSVASSRGLYTTARSALRMKTHENGSLERKCSIDDGMLRFYLTRPSSHRRSELVKSKLKKSHYVARTFLKL